MHIRNTELIIACAQDMSLSTWKNDGCSRIRRDDDRVNNSIINIFPATFYYAVNTSVAHLCICEAAAGLGGNGEMILSIHPDAAYGLEQPFTDGAFGIMIKRCDTTLGLGSFSGFPNSCRAVLGHKQPTGHFFVFKQAICCIQVILRQNIQN